MFTGMTLSEQEEGLRLARANGIPATIRQDRLILMVPVGPPKLHQCSEVYIESLKGLKDVLKHW